MVEPLGVARRGVGLKLRMKIAPAGKAPSTAVRQALVLGSLPLPGVGGMPFTTSCFPSVERAR